MILWKTCRIWQEGWACHWTLWKLLQSLLIFSAPVSSKLKNNSESPGLGPRSMTKSEGLIRTRSFTDVPGHFCLWNSVLTDVFDNCCDWQIDALRHGHHTRICKLNNFNNTYFLIDPFAWVISYESFLMSQRVFTCKAVFDNSVADVADKQSALSHFIPEISGAWYFWKISIAKKW